MSRHHSPSEELSVSLFSRDNKAFDVVVLDLDSDDREGSVLLDVPRSEDFAVPVGETAVLLFSGVEPDRTIQVNGTVVFQTECNSAIRYEFKLDEAATRHVNDLVDRRRSDRVRPDSEMSMHVAIQDEDGGTWVQAILRDMSEKGVSVLVDPRNEPLLFSAWKVRLSLPLPGEDEALDLVGFVRYRRLTDSRIQYGIELDDQTPELARRVARFAAYVATRGGAACP